MTVYFVWLFCCTVLFTKRAKISISSDIIQNMFSTLVKNLKKEVQVIFASKKDLYRHFSTCSITGSITIASCSYVVRDG